MITTNLTAKIVNWFNTKSDLIAHECKLGTFLSGLWTDVSNCARKADEGVILTAVGTALLADLNTGAVVVPALAGYKITPISYWVEATGAFNTESTGATIALSTTADTPVAVATFAKAGLTDGGVLSSAVVTNVTKGAGFLAAGTASKALQLKTNAAFTVGTSVRYKIDYILTK